MDLLYFNIFWWMVCYYSIWFLSCNSFCWRFIFCCNLRLMLYFINIMLFLFSIWVIFAFQLWLGLFLRCIWVFIKLCFWIDLSRNSFLFEVFQNIWWVINLWYLVQFSIANLIIFKSHIFLSIWRIFDLLQWRAINNPSRYFFLLPLNLRNIFILNNMTIFDYSKCIVTILSIFSLSRAMDDRWGNRLIENDWS